MEEIIAILDQIVSAKTLNEENFEDITHRNVEVLEKANSLIETDMENKIRQFDVEVHRIRSNSESYDEETLNLCNIVEQETQKHKQKIEGEMEKIRCWYLGRIEEEKRFLKKCLNKYDELCAIAQTNLDITVSKHKLRPDAMNKELRDDIGPLKKTFNILKAYSERDFATSVGRLNLVYRELNIKVQKVLRDSNEHYEKIIRRVKDMPYHFRDCKVTRFGVHGRTFEGLDFKLTEEQKARAKDNMKK